MHPRTTPPLYLLALLVALAACSDSTGGDDDPQDPDEGSDNAKVAHIVVTPDQGFLWVGEQLTLAAFAYDEGGTLLKDVSFTWSGTDASVAGIEDGRVQGASSGVSLVSASAGNVTSSPVAVLVLDVPEDVKTSDEYLAEAAEMGLLTPHEVLTYRVYATFSDPRLPLQYKGRATGAFETEVLQDVIDQYDTLPAATKAALDPFLVPPADGASWLSPPGSGQGLGNGRPTCKADTDGWLFVNSTQAKVNVWYRYTVPGQKAKAAVVSAAIENEIWPTLFGTLGFPEPLPDSNTGCSLYSPKLDVFLVSNVEFRGLTVPEFGAPYQSSVFIMLNESLSVDELKAAAAHEMMHASHWAFRTKSFQASYGWLRDAVANWAIDAVYGTSLQVEQTFANCYLSSVELPLQDRSTGHCLANGKSEVERDYGAYLWFQYIAHTLGPSAVKSILTATQSVDTGVEAIDNVIPGGFQKHWPLFGKLLWNQDPVASKSASFSTWDALSEPVKSVDLKGDLGGAPEKKDELEAELKNLSHRVYYFDFMDPQTRSVLFYNGFFEQKKAGKHVKVQALWMDGSNGWQEEDWSDYEYVALCRDMKDQRARHLVIIFSNAETEVGGSVTASEAPYLKRNNVGCWKLQGSMSAIEKQPNWTGLGRQGVTTASFEVDAAGMQLDFKHPLFPDTLRVGANLLMSPSGSFSFEVAHGDGRCSYSYGPASFVLAPFSGFMKTNPFPELHSPDAAVTAWLQQPARAYVAALVDNSGFEERVTGRDCESTHYGVTGGLLVTNDVNGDVYVNPPTVLPDGRFSKTYSALGFTFDWSFTPQTQP